MQIGFIGQGWIGKNYADDFESRGFSVVRYGLQDEYAANREKVANCDIVFIAVPTETLPEKGFDDSVVRSVLSLVGSGNVAVIKSTIMPGTTAALQEAYPDILLMHSPEFLRKKTAAHDAKFPDRNILGVTELSRPRAQQVMSVLAKAPYEKIVDAKEAEMVKYAGNCYLFWKLLFMNMVYDLSIKLSVDYDTVVEMLVEDPRIGASHVQVLHEAGRGAGGHCLIKDFAAFARKYREECGNSDEELLAHAEKYNRALLEATNNSLEVLKNIYGV